LQDQSDASHAVSQLNFCFLKKQGVTLWLLIAIFAAKKWKGNIYFGKFCLQISNLIFKELPNTRQVELVRLHEKAFPKIGSSEFSVASCTILSYP